MTHHPRLSGGQGVHTQNDPPPRGKRGSRGYTHKMTHHPRLSGAQGVHTQNDPPPRGKRGSRGYTHKVTHHPGVSGGQGVHTQTDPLPQGKRGHHGVVHTRNILPSHSRPRDMAAGWQPAQCRPDGDLTTQLHHSPPPQSAAPTPNHGPTGTPPDGDADWRR